MIETRVEGALGTIVLNRPQQLNALAGTMREELLSAIDGFACEAAVRVIVLRGAGKGFCAGGDLGRLRELREREDSLELGRLLGLGSRIVHALRSCPKPVIASVNGAAAGAGLALALACDLRIAAASAVFSAAFVKIGLVPDWGATWLLPRAVGMARALELALSGRRIDAAEAAAIGLVHRVAADEDLEAETRAWAEQLAELPALATGEIKQLLERSASTSLSNQLLAEQLSQLRCFLDPQVLERLASNDRPRSR